MTRMIFPQDWSSLRYPNVRSDLLLELADLANPTETARWLNPDPKGPVIGFDKTVEFLIDDYHFFEVPGRALFDETEVAFVKAVVEAIEEIFRSKRSPDSAYALSHAAWPRVEQASQIALDHLRTRGDPCWSEEGDQ